jgi:hypothetical protein
VTRSFFSSQWLNYISNIIFHFAHHTLVPLQSHLTNFPQTTNGNKNTDDTVGKHGPKTRLIPLQQHTRLLLLLRKRRITVLLSSTARNTQRHDLAAPHAKRRTKLGSRIEHSTSQRLRLLRKAVADDDESYSKEDVNAEGREDLRPEGQVPVVPRGIEQCHDERAAGADDGTASYQV